MCGGACMSVEMLYVWRCMIVCRGACVCVKVHAYRSTCMGIEVHVCMWRCTYVCGGVHICMKVYIVCRGVQMCGVICMCVEVHVCV